MLKHEVKDHAWSSDAPPAEDIPETQRAHKSLRETFFEYSQNTSCHGVSYIFSEDIHRARKVVWTLMILGSLCVYGLLGFSAVERFISDEISTSYSIHEEQEEFPAMIICSSSGYRRSYIEEQFVKGVYLPLFTDADLELERKVKWSLVFNGLGHEGGNPNNSLTAAAKAYFVNETNIVVNAASLSIKDVMTRNNMDARKLMSILNTTTLCMYIHDDKPNCEMIKEAHLLFSITDKYILEGGMDDIVTQPVAGFALPKCATEVDSNLPVFCNVTYHLDAFFGRCTKVRFFDSALKRFKSNTHIKLEIYISSNDYEYDTYWKQRDEPTWNVKFQHEEEFIHMLRHTNVAQFHAGLHLMSLEKQESVSLPPPYSRCLDTDAANFITPLKHYKTAYSFDACESECKNAISVEADNCRLSPMTNMSYTVPFCSTSVSVPFNCSYCLPACRQASYRVHLTQIKERFFHVGNGAHPDVLLVLNLDVPTSVTQQQLAYPAASLFGDMGGNMGLFIGASLVTIMEVLDLLLVVLFSWAGRRLRREPAVGSARR